jgi:hypothetical protein
MSLLLRLAVVERQLLCHYLDDRSRVRLARCCRSLLVELDEHHSFAWKTVRSVRLTATSPAELAQLQRRHTGLLAHHAPLHLCCFSDSLAAESSFAAADVFRWPPLTQLTSLEMRCELTDAQWADIVQHPSAQRLTRMGCLGRRRWTEEQLQLVCERLPRLRSLAVDLPTRASLSYLQKPLTLLHSLTELEVGEMRDSRVLFAGLHAAGGTLSLQVLKLRNPLFRTPLEPESPIFADVCGLRCLRGLTHLSLRHFEAGRYKDNRSSNSLNGNGAAELGSSYRHLSAPSAEEYAAGFAQLTQLRIVRLADVLHVDALLPHLQHAPSLTLVQLECEADVNELVRGGGKQSTVLPSAELLATLLQSAVAQPELSIQLVVPSPIQWPSRSGSEEQLQPAVDSQQQRWDNLRHCLALHRVELVLRQTARFG